MEVVFAKTDYQYQSYTDFWRLVELSGFRVVPLSQLDLDAEVCYVTTPHNGETHPAIEAARGRCSTKRAKLVWWNLERPVGGGYPPDNLAASAAPFDRVWSSDRHYALSTDPRQLFVVLGSHAGLAESAAPSAKLYDYCHMMYVYGRRQPVVDQVQRVHSVAPACWGPQRDAVLRASRAMLNVHQSPHPIGEPLRFALAAAYGVPLVSENMADPYPLVAGRHYISAQYADLAAVAVAAAKTDLSRYGRELRRLLVEEHGFRRSIEAAVREMNS